MKKLSFLFLAVVMLAFRAPQYEVGDSVKDFALKNTD
jgi:hypothetical protein